MGVCTFGTETCALGAWGSCVGGIRPGMEVCDAAMLDEDCDGMSNEGCMCIMGTTRSCGCGGMQTCSSVGAWGGCTGGTPPMTETCNGRDDDCNGVIDDGAADCLGTLSGMGNTCTIQYRPGSGSAYLLCTTTRSWTAARDACAAVGYHLVTVDSMAEQDWLHMRTMLAGAGEWWIGLMDIDGDGDYEDDEWHGGMRTSYRRWGSGEPTHTGQCVFLDNGDSGGWDDKSCGGGRRFVCEAP
jgi:hypothetical protein